MLELDDMTSDFPVGFGDGGIDGLNGAVASCGVGSGDACL